MDPAISSVFIIHWQFPFAVEVAGYAVYLHAISEFLAYFIGFRYFLRLRKRQGDTYSSTERIWIFIAAIFGSFLGSHLIGSLERPNELPLVTNYWDYFYNNKTVLAGFLFGTWAVELIKLPLRKTRSSGDLFVFPMLLGLILGRIGCFTMGVYEQTYGTPTKFFTGMNLGDGILRHPVMLYEIAFLICIWIFEKRMQKRVQLADGALFKIFMFAYLVFRFLLDFIKPPYPVWLGLSTIQLTALAGMLYYLPFFLQPKKFIVHAR